MSAKNNNKLTAKKSILGAIPFLREKRISIGVCSAFFSRKASRNCCEGSDETLLDRVAYKSAIVDFPPSILVNCQTEVIFLLLFLIDRAISPRHVQVKKYGV